MARKSVRKGQKRPKESRAEKLHRVFQEAKSLSEILKMREKWLGLGPLNVIGVGGGFRKLDTVKFGISAHLPDELNDMVLAMKAFSWLSEVIEIAGGKLKPDIKEVWSGLTNPQKRYIVVGGIVENLGELDVSFIRSEYARSRKFLGLRKKKN